MLLTQKHIFTPKKKRSDDGGGWCVSGVMAEENKKTIKSNNACDT